MKYLIVFYVENKFSDRDVKNIAPIYGITQEEILSVHVYAEYWINPQIIKIRHMLISSYLCGEVRIMRLI